MKIGINLLYLKPGVVGGTETYADGLLRGLAASNDGNEYRVFVNKESAHWPLPALPNFERVVCPVSTGSVLGRYFYEQVRLPRLARLHSLDVLHSLGYVSPLTLTCPSVVTVPDLNFRAFGKSMSLPRRMALELFVRGSARRAARVIAISEFGKGEIIRGLGVQPDRVDVTYLAAGKLENSVSGSAALQSLYATHGIRRPYMLAFSSHSPNKNIPNLLRAFERARDEHGVSHQLAFVGHPPEGGEALSSIERLQQRGSVAFCGYLDRSVLQPILAGSDLFVFPSLYEGFGIPVLEAMTAGVPVACSSAGPLPEVAGSAARYFDPHSVSDMAKVLAEVAKSRELREDLRNKGWENVKRFSWETTAGETRAVYDRVVEGRDQSSRGMP